MGLLTGKRLLITGVLTDASIAYGVAQTALDEGADIVLTGAGRGLSLTERISRKLRLPDGREPVEVLELDITSTEQMDAVVARLTEKWGALDGCLHAIGFAPQSCLGDDFFAASWDDVATAVQISTYSYSVLAKSLRPLFQAAGGKPCIARLRCLARRPDSGARKSAVAQRGRCRRRPRLRAVVALQGAARG